MNTHIPNNEVNVETIHDQFLDACKTGDANPIKYLLDHSLGRYIDLEENDFQCLKLIEKHNKELLEYVLLKRVNPEGRIQNGHYYIDAKTYYCKLSIENQKNKKLALSMLVNANEYLDLIPEEIKTPAFLNQLAKSQYKGNIFDFDFIYTKAYKKFLINYIAQGHIFSKKIKLEDQLLQDRDFIATITQYKCQISYLISHIYGNDLEIMKNIALNEDEAFRHMNALMRNTISKDKSTALKLIDLDCYNYMYLNKSMQLEETIINKALSMKPAIYEDFLPQLKNNTIKTLEYVTKFDIDVKFLSDLVKDNKEIATIMTEKNGNNLEYFPLFKEDIELVQLALKTSKRLSLLPRDMKTDEKVKEIVMQANIEENSFNLHYMPKTVKEDRQFVLQLIKENRLFKEDLFALVNDYGHHKQDHEIVKECIEKHTDLYGRFFNFKEDYEIIHIYLENMKKQRKGSYSLNDIPAKIKAEASMHKASVDKYVFNKVLEKKAQQWEKTESVKTKKVKI